MQYSDLPTRISVPFAESGPKNTIPVPSQVSITPGAASFTTGFPPLTMTPIAAGGIPPFGQDMNGILFDESSWTRWVSAGGMVQYDAAFSTAIGGYPKGAVLKAASDSGAWMSTVENNSSDPDAGGAGWASIVPRAAALTASATLTPQQAGVVSIAITANGTFTLPLANAADGLPISFTFVRTDTTAFTATIQRAGADTIEGLTSLSLAVGERLTLISDGVSAWRIAAGVAGRLLNVQVFAASGTYTPTPGTGSVVVEVQGGGGAGGGTTLPTVGNVSLGAPGGAGAYGRGRFTAVQIGASLPVTVGAGGVATAATAGPNGGTSSFGALLSAPGGVGGGMLNNQAPPTINGNGTSSAAAAGANIDSAKGSVGSVTLALSATAVQGGPGGFSRFGAGAGGPGLNVNGMHAETAGSGGSGCAINNAGGGSYRGGNGAAGQVIVWEYT